MSTKKEIEMITRERYSEDDYREMLDQCYGAFKIGYLTFDASRILEELDPIAFHVGLSEYQETEEVYICPECGEEHADEESARDCCNVEDDDEQDEDA